MAKKPLEGKKDLKKKTAIIFWHFDEKWNTCKFCKQNSDRKSNFFLVVVWKKMVQNFLNISIIVMVEL